MIEPPDLLSAFVDGELDAREHDAVAAHLAGCAGCTTELEEVSAARAAMRSLPLLEAPPGLIPETQQVITVTRSRPRWWRRPAYAAAAAVGAVVLAAGVVGGGGGDAVPLDLDSVAEQHLVRTSVEPGSPLVQISFSGGDR